MRELRCTDDGRMVHDEPAPWLDLTRVPRQRTFEEQESGDCPARLPVRPPLGEWHPLPDFGLTATALGARHAIARARAVCPTCGIKKVRGELGFCSGDHRRAFASDLYDAGEVALALRLLAPGDAGLNIPAPRY